MIAEADYGLTDMAVGKKNTSQADENLRVQFNLFPHPDQDATAKEGRPIYKEIPYIMIMVPGERDIVHRPAWERDFQRFPTQHRAFLNKENQDHASGTPLKMVPWMTMGQVKELEYFNCYTLEQLANMPDSTAQKFMQINKLKQLAKDHLQAAKEAAPLTAMRAEMDTKDSQIAALQAEMAKLTKLVEKLSTEED